MKNKFCSSIIVLLFALLPAAAGAQALPDNPEPARADSSGWSRVQDLANGEEIDVAHGRSHAVPCRFAGATDDDLFCESLFSGREYRFSRAEVESVRMEDKRRNMRILIGTFAAAGFIWGVAAPPSGDNGTPRFLVGLGGAGIGALAGCAVSLPAAFLIPGRLVYRRPPLEHKPSASAPAEEQAPTPPRTAAVSQ
ncbi:MAG TPA: hypothetical protein VN776_06690 [Terracidiphilus sp.]|nr:hypothetical protein [Terracidiphilus sp.]